MELLKGSKRKNKWDLALVLSISGLLRGVFYFIPPEVSAVTEGPSCCYWGKNICGFPQNWNREHGRKNLKMIG